jgi:hypothetical protein
MTFSNDAAFVTPVVDMMMAFARSRGRLHDAARPASPDGARSSLRPGAIGTRAASAPTGRRSTTTAPTATASVSIAARTGSNAIAQYASPLAQEFGDTKRVPEQFLLWFHHVSWDQRMSSGRSLWDELVYRYTRGVDQVKQMRETWRGLAGKIDAERYVQIASFLAIQEKEAQWWRDASIAYFQSINGLPLPAASPRRRMRSTTTRRCRFRSRRDSGDHAIASPQRRRFPQRARRGHAHVRRSRTGRAGRSTAVARDVPGSRGSCSAISRSGSGAGPARARNVKVDFAGKSVRSRADKTGRWEAQLPALHAGGPYVLTATSAGTTQTAN